MRVIRYGHDETGRPGCGEQTVLLTTVLAPEALGAMEAVKLYPWRWAEESVLAEIKVAMQRGGAPLLRGKTVELAQQELYGLLLAHYLTRKVMAEAAQAAAVRAWELSFTDCLEVMRKWLSEETRQGWKRRYRVLLEAVGRRRLRPRRDRPYPRQKKAARQKWPFKRAGQAPPARPGKPFAQAAYVIEPLAPTEEGGP